MKKKSDHSMEKDDINIYKSIKRKYNRWPPMSTLSNMTV